MLIKFENEQQKEKILEFFRKNNICPPNIKKGCDHSLVCIQCWEAYNLISIEQNEEDKRPIFILKNKEEMEFKTEFINTMMHGSRCPSSFHIYGHNKCHMTCMNCIKESINFIIEEGEEM